MSRYGKATIKRKQVLDQVGDAARKGAEKLAFQIEGQTKVNIKDNGQINTGFMLNSVYVVEETGGEYLTVEDNERLAPEQDLPDDALAGVAVAAEYAIYQEAQNGFLFPAAEKVLNNKSVVKAIRENL